MIKIFLVLIYTLFIAIVDGAEVKSYDCSGNRVELAIVLDASSSIGVENFTLAKQFLSDVVGNFVIGEDKSRIGMITFADDPEILFTLTKLKTIGDIKKSILDAKFLTGVTALGAAIKLAGTGILHESRSGIQKVIIALTDGQNNKFPPSVKMAKMQKDAGVLIFAIGIGSETNPVELKGISSDGMFYQLNTFSQLAGIVDKIKSTLCKVVIRNIINACETEGDISFIIDGKEDALELYPTQLELIKYVLNLLEISKTNQRVAIVVDHQGILVPLNQFTNRNEYINYLTKKEFEIGSKIGSGLQESGKFLAADRTKVPKLAVLMRTYKSQSHEDEVENQAALALRTQGCNIVTIALGPAANITYLDGLSTTRKTISIADPNFQSTHVTEVAENICQNLKELYIECIGKKLDIVLVLDCSSSIGPRNWVKQLDFVSRIVLMLDIGKNTTQLGLVYFNSEAYIGFPLDKYSTKTEIIAAIRNLTFSEGGTAIGDALRLAHTQLTNKRRKHAASVVILVTDGQNNMGLTPESEALKIRNEGIYIICIGITDEISKEQLMRISSNNRYYPVPDYNSLEFMSVEALTKESCQAIRKPKKKCDDFDKAGHQEL